jgi:hypothetical protein
MDESYYNIFNFFVIHYSFLKFKVLYFKIFYFVKKLYNLYSFIDSMIFFTN